MVRYSKARKDKINKYLVESKGVIPRRKYKELSDMMKIIQDPKKRVSVKTQTETFNKIIEYRNKNTTKIFKTAFETNKQPILTQKNATINPSKSADIKKFIDSIDKIIQNLDFDAFNLQLIYTRTGEYEDKINIEGYDESQKVKVKHLFYHKINVNFPLTQSYKTTKIKKLFQLMVNNPNYYKEIIITKHKNKIIDTVNNKGGSLENITFYDNNYELREFKFIKLVKRDKRYVKQIYRDSKFNTCVLDVIENEINDKIEIAQTKRTKDKYNKQLIKINEYKKIYNDGLEYKEICKIADDLHFNFSIKTPFEKNNYIETFQCHYKPLYNVDFLNSRFNHVEDYNLNFLECENVKDIKKLENEIREKKEFYFKSSYNMLYYNGIYYKEKNNDKEKYNEAVASMNYKYKWLNESVIMENDLNNEYITIFNNDNNMNITYGNSYKHEGDIKQLDMERAYTQFKKCDYYVGFPYKLGEFIKGEIPLNFAIKNNGIYTLKNIDLSGCKENIKLHLEKLGFNDVLIESSPMIKFLSDNNVKFDIVEGTYSYISKDFEFTEKMKEKYEGIRGYSKWCGINSLSDGLIDYTAYILDNEENNKFLDTITYNNMFNCFDGEKVEGYKNVYVSRKNENSINRGHIVGFIKSYMRINVLNKLFKIKYDKVLRVNVDGIYYVGKVRQDELFKRKEVKINLKVFDLAGEGLDDNIDFDNIKKGGKYGEYKKPLFNYDVSFCKRVVWLKGAGGTGKTWFLKNEVNLIRPLYTGHSWILAKSNNDTFKNVSVHNRLMNFSFYNVYKKNNNSIIIDESSVINKKDFKKICKIFKDFKLIFVGDNGYQCQAVGGENMEKIEAETIEFKEVKRTNDEKLKEFMILCRNFIDWKAKEIHIKKSIKQNFKVISRKELIKEYNIKDCILLYTHKEIEKMNNDLIKAGKEKRYVVKSSNSTHSKGQILYEDIGKNCKLSYCHTVHSFQGQTIREGKLYINLSLIDLRNEFYTAVSRVVNSNQLVFFK